MKWITPVMKGSVFILAAGIFPGVGISKTFPASLPLPYLSGDITNAGTGADTLQIRSERESSQVYAEGQSRTGPLIQTLTLQTCYELIRKNYPAADKVDLQRKINNLQKMIVNSGWHPELSVHASAGYRSHVTELPFPDPPVFSRDHYNVALDLNQPLFDGGRTRAAASRERYTGEAELANIETELQQVRNQVDQVFFRILILEKQRETVDILREEINRQLDVVRSGVGNGILLPGNRMVLEAELLRAKQQMIGIESDILGGKKVLGQILGLSNPGDLSLERPDSSDREYRKDRIFHRAEYDLLTANREVLESGKAMAKAGKLPTLSFFTQTGYGRPGFNMFDDNLQLNWVIGVRAQWSLKSWNNASGEAEIRELQQKKLEADMDVFTRQLEADLRRYEEEIESLQRQLREDREVLLLRGRIVSEKESLLKEGVITSTEYITELHAEHRARLDLEVRKIRLLQAITEFKTKSGAP